MQTQMQAQPGVGAAAVGKGYCGRERRRQGGQCRKRVEAVRAGMVGSGW
jgi:hypothetical protein